MRLPSIRRKCIASKQNQNDNIRRTTDDTDIVHRTDEEDDAPVVNRFPCELLSSILPTPTPPSTSLESLSAMQQSPCQEVEVAKERPNQTLRSISDIAIDNNSRTATTVNDTESDTTNCDTNHHLQVKKSVHYIDGRDTTYQDIKYYDHYGTELSVITRVYYRPYTSVEENKMLFYTDEDYAKFRRLASTIFTLEDRALFYCITVCCDEQSGAVPMHEPPTNAKKEDTTTANVVDRQVNMAKIANVRNSLHSKAA